MRPSRSEIPTHPPLTEQMSYAALVEAKAAEKARQDKADETQRVLDEARAALQDATADLIAQTNVLKGAP
jgi:hypothetical protein